MTPHAPGPLSPSAEPTRREPVLDIEAGVERLMGNRPIYLRALARFRHDYRETVLAIRAARDAGDAPRARRLAHTLKGAAGMIEAPALQTAALALETALRDEAGGVDALLVRVDATLGEVLRELDGMVLDDDTHTPSLTAPAPATGGLAHLRAMLDIGDGAAVEQVEAAYGELAAYLGQGGVEELSAAVAEFDYERALALLDRRDGPAGR